MSIERGRAALVTGSTAGIGREVAWSLRATSLTSTHESEVSHP